MPRLKWEEANERNRVNRDLGTGADPFIECQECEEGFPVPAGLKLNFVDRRR
jgi:hypothetical protein